MCTIEFSRVLFFAVLFTSLVACGGSDPLPPVKLAKLVENRQCEAPRMTMKQLNEELIAAKLQLLSQSCASDGLGSALACGTVNPYVMIIEVGGDDIKAASALGYSALSHFPTMTVPLKCRL